MKRRENGSYRYITASCYRRMPLLGRPAIRDSFAHHLALARAKWKFRLAAWVAMPEHIHLMIWPGPIDDPATPPLTPILADFKSTFGKFVIARWRRLKAPFLPLLVDSGGTTRYWQPGGGFDRNVRNDKELPRELAYIHNNPVKRGLVKEATDWPWSSARWYAGMTEGAVPIDPVWWYEPPRSEPYDEGLDGPPDGNG